MCALTDVCALSLSVCAEALGTDGQLCVCSESCTDGQTTASRERAKALLGMATVVKELDTILLFRMVDDRKFGSRMLAGKKDAFTYKRKMRILSDGLVTGVDKIRIFLKNVFEDEIDKLLKVSNCTCLIGFPDVLQQVCHTDYKDSHEHPPKNNYIVFVSVFDGTKIVVFDETKTSLEILLNVGDVFVGRGDLMHAGAAYDKHNVRLHFYVTHNLCPVPNNETYLVKRKIKL